MRRACIIGASGVIGGELLRLLLGHNNVEVVCATSRRFAGEFIYRVHPNLRGFINLKFTQPSIDAVLKSESDVVFLALPHGESVKWVPKLVESGLLAIDLSADFRLKNPDDYVKWYHWPQPHPYPDLLKAAAYGLPELHRDEIKATKVIAVPGCMATASIVSLAPLVKGHLINNDFIVVDAKIASSGAGAEGTVLDYHWHRTHVVRPYQPVGHRHTAEIEQELSLLAGSQVNVAFTPHAVDMVRGIFVTGHARLSGSISEPDLWRAYRGMYGNERFIRIVKDKAGLAHYPSVKYVVGTNMVDVGFELDQRLNRVVVFSAIDNLIRGAAGQAIQSFNINQGFPEDEGLRFITPYPV
ncbi:N-acetyl-gamma-glutamyl-phosphate reductase [Caldivirga maquilingensis]|uniref:Putative [LysW]-L-2-aminoadipate/[LysW]-L-glutamate phosphate reductase n=1 Tax=Caldivirga maquilingensis (strain ATCC 700844 / DSM 13496 / JCM 10307 / IC-167) TaxID=397948 RepID=LYSY_CALMQ|nr:N-acetyl-gamma-glutamyl-phosphate reductase [Caldivirga maquilingensis]A8M8Q9.1 RecName: Full=Putative [LysW]-L-2-aminoadipate/[LysW]-L-glutamate phosphate reductase [Caldivirga maquilingensis IC-167]ABW02128.1 N-acetyl-gamma-glutamyl-phosphate reductase [Caldivirga maquilingensis IC-167]